jgi:hypothetical protein
MGIKNKKLNMIIGAAVWMLWVVSCEQSPGADPFEAAAQAGQEYLEDTSGEAYVPYITAVSITQYPDKTYFAKAQAFSYEGLELSFVYDNGDYGRKLSSSEYTVEDIDTTALAPATDSRPKLVTVSILNTPEGADLGGFPPVTYGIRIDSSTSILGGMSMTSPPSKLSYNLGEDFSAAGLAVSATYEGGDKHGQTVSVSASAAVASGYSKYRRGKQQVTLKLNGASLGTVEVTVKIPPNAEITLNRFNDVVSTLRDTYLTPVRIKGMPFDLPRANLRATVRTGGKFTLDWSNKGITEADSISGFDSNSAGLQRCYLNLNPEGYKLPFDVYVADAAPEVWFDYGYRRHKGAPHGAGFALDGKGVYYAAPNESIVLTPVRFLLGYDADGKNTGVSYSWTFVSGPSSCNMTGNSGEFCTFTPKAAGTYRLRVSVTGRNFVTGGSDTKSAETDVVCYTAQAGTKYTLKPTKHFAPGQHNEGDGYGWSLGAALGYEFWALPNGAATLQVYGNPFGPWGEAGIVWVQYDSNGNGIPDETWYEIKGDEDDTVYKSMITRRYALSYFRGPNPAGSKDTGATGLVYDPALDTEKINSQFGTGQKMFRTVYWVDCKGRVGRLGGWPFGTNLSDDLDTRVTFTGTLLRDDGEIAVDRYGDMPLKSYVDTPDASDKYPYGHFNVARDAIRADGSAANLNPALVRFVKVQTAFFRYGGVFGNVSTEIVYGTNLPDQSGGFPMPDGLVE